MKKNKLIIFGIITALSITFLSSCVKEEWVKPDPLETPDYSSIEGFKVISVRNLKARFDGDTTLLNDSLILEANVVTTDEFGNFYKQLFVQDSTGAICILVDQKEMFLDYPIGSKLVIKLGGLCLGEDAGVIQLGNMYWNDAGYSFGRIQGFTVIDDHLIKTSENSVITPKSYKITELGNAQLSSMVRLENVQFISTAIGQTYGNPSTFGNIDIVDAQGNKVVLYTSSYCTYATQTIAEGSGYIDAIYTLYNGKAELLINNVSDIHFTNPRF